MSAKSKYRGNEIEYNGKDWIFSDTKEIVSKNKNRACGNCGKEKTKEGHDHCLGTLPNVMNACCGHGSEKEAYVQFANKWFGGKEALKIISKLKDMTEQEIKLRNEMKVRIKAMNKVLTDDVLDLKSTKVLIRLTHPNYREEWQHKFDKIMRKEIENDE